MARHGADSRPKPRWRILGVITTVILATLFLLLLVSGAADAAFGLVGITLLVTALWHLIVGHSWASGVIPIDGRKAGAATAALGTTFFGIGMSLPSSESTSAAVPAAETVSTLSADTKPSVVASPSPTATALPSPTSIAPTTADDSVLAVDVLAMIPIKGRAPKTGYDPKQFGQRWADVDRNGCDQRNDVLNRDLAEVTYKPGTNDCVVLTGILEIDPLTGTRIDFERGNDTPNAVQIDHVVALSDAWQKGAQQLTDQQRLFFANDPLNLLTVDGAAKSEDNAASWLPKNNSFRCIYVATQVAVKHKYSLWMTQAEHDAIARILESCPGQAMPEDSGIHVPAPEDTPEPTTQVSESTKTAAPATTPASTPMPLKKTEASKPSTATPTATKAPDAHTSTPAPAKKTEAAKTPTPTPTPEKTSTPPKPAKPQSEDVHYKNCDAVRAAGKAPLHEGDPGYRAGLDRDKDGVACE